MRSVFYHALIEVTIGDGPDYLGEPLFKDGTVEDVQIFPPELDAEANIERAVADKDIALAEADTWPAPRWRGASA